MRMGKHRLWALLMTSIGPLGCAPDAQKTVESIHVAREALDSTSAWTTNAPMNVPRKEHAVLLLSDKRVLVVGGATNSADAAEIYEITIDPDTQVVSSKWTSLPGPDTRLLTSKTGCRPALTQIDNNTVLVVSTDWDNNASNVSTFDLQTLDWTPRFDLPNATCSPWAVSLDDGNVFILADDETTSQVVPYLYNTTTHTISSVTPLPAPKEGNWIHSSAIKLVNGYVLVSGGAGTNTLVQNNEAILIDPKDPANPWLPAGEMAIRRAKHALALLPNRNVLAIGGFTQGPFEGQWSETAEMFDVDKRTWGMVAPMSNARVYGHTATTLNSGLILVIGGSTSSTAELFDPSSNEWTPIESSGDRRYYGHSSTLLDDDRVLVTGGVSIVNGVPDTGSTETSVCNALIFAWQSQKSIDTASRGFHSSTSLDEKTVLIVGGAREANDGTLQSLQDAWTYSADDGFSAAAPNPTYPRAFHTATKLSNGQVFVAGGMDDSAVISEIYGPDPASDPNAPSYIWTAAARLPLATMRAAATLLDDGSVLHAGGIYSGGANDVSAEVLLYKPDSDEWETTANLPENEKRHGHTLTKLSDGSVLAIGGFSGCPGSGYSPSAVNSVARYYPTTKTWTAVKPMNQGRAYHTATLLKNGQVLVAGGGGSISDDCLRPTWNTVHGSAEVYDPDANTWTNVGILDEARTEHLAILLASTKVLIAGGKRTSTGRTLSTAELYDADTKSWSTTSRLQRGRYGHSLTLVPTGVLAIGGFHSFTFSENEVNIELFPQAMQGNPCSLDEQCTSGICAGSVCCDQACDNSCMACSKAAAASVNKAENKKEIDGVCEDISGCSDFACLPETGLCKTECSDVNDCVAGYVCDPLNQCIEAIPNASTLDQSGCRAASSESTNPPWGALFLAASALAARRHRRPARNQRNS